MDATTQKRLPDKLEWLKFSSISWMTDNSGLIYNRFDKPSIFKKNEKQSSKAGTETDQVKFSKLYFHKLNTS